MKIKYFLLLLLFLVVVQFVYPQKFEVKSPRITLNIKPPPPDTLSPILKLSLPIKMDGFPIYSRDSIFTLTGMLEDNNNRSYLLVNDVVKGVFENGNFKLDVSLNYGENTINIKVKDKKENFVETELSIFQDPNADIYPPLIKIVEPLITTERGIKVIKKAVVEDSLFYLRAKITDESSLLGIWLNDYKIDSLVNDEFVYNLDKTRLDSIWIKAVDTYGNVSFEKFSLLEMDPFEEETFENDDYHALIIAIDDYSDSKLPDLDHPIKDSQELINVLINKYTFELKNITFLKNPNRSTIINTLQTLRKSLKSSDNLLVYYAGHGYWDEEIEQGYWLPSDAKGRDDLTNLIPNSVIRDYIRGIKTRHTLLIADACFSGGIFVPRDPLLNADVSVLETYKYPSRKAITSGALTMVPDESVFAKFLIKRLDENDEKYLTTHKLYINLRDAVINNSLIKQTPVYGTIHGTNDEGLGDFIFIRK